MRRMTIVALGLLAAIALAPDAFAWGAYHGGFGGASYHGAGGGSFSRGGGSWSATTARGGSASGGGGSWSAHSAYGGSASGGGGSWSAHGAYGGAAYGGYGGYHGAYYGGTYNGGTAVVTPAYTGWGAAAAGAAVGAAATSAAYAAPTTNYYPPPHYQPNALFSASGATAQMRPGAQAVLTECKPDIVRFCSQVAPGQNRIKACMKEHLRELSEPCKEGLFQAWLRQ